ncbi:MAG: hypothetical protein KJT01_16880, partial [Gemmatimonadetes bacterium]|nr:hypothetical protein [Gemmatimonadota bacterium]
PSIPTAGGQLALAFGGMAQGSAGANERRNEPQSEGRSEGQSERRGDAGERPGGWDLPPRALVEGGRLRVVSWGGARGGVQVGMTVAEGSARCAALACRPWDPERVAEGVTAVTAALLEASPQVTPVPEAPGYWWVGVGGFGGVGGELGCAERVLAVARRWHPEARVAVADSCVAARAALWATGGRRGKGVGEVGAIRVVPPGGCAAYLAPAPLALLPMPAEVREALEALGVRSVGGLAALAPGEVEARWGAEGVAAWRLARGDDPRRPGVARVVAERVASAELAMPVDRVEPLRFLVRAQVEQVVAGCVRDGRAAAAVAITLLVDGGRRDGGVRAVTREVRPARPVARVGPLFEQCWGVLEGWRLPAPVVGVAVSVPATAPLAADQGDLLVPSWRDAAMQADGVCARLRAGLDPGGTGEVVVHPVAGDAYRPEGTGGWVAADPLVLGEAPLPRGVTGAGGVSDAVLRLLPVPEAVEVERPHGRPEAVWWRGTRVALTAVVGPERLDGAWWRGADAPREYWRVTAPAEGELLLYHHPGAGWYLQGWYD